MKGKPVEAAVAKLGMPTSQQPIMNETAYIWSTSYDDVGVIPTYSTGSLGSVPVTTSSFTVGPAGTASCRLRVFVKGDGLIRGWDVEGGQRACRRYADDLR